MAARDDDAGRRSWDEASMTIAVDQLAGRLFPAVPVPFRRDGAVHSAALDRYIAWMAGQSIGGVAVWAHTGRGLRLDEPLADRVLGAWRRALPADRCVIAAAGPRPD